ncbi:cytochrome P450 [Streptomyces sp. GbtcB6]|uniref:cytochrome P450 n=1 Tax=Streptomyces sp. GbtcB6 TaxID=2824751 RepID=UPI001C2F2CF2|nr:cytochrome P450 [Streptomyces sp. GbtcB6]
MTAHRDQAVTCPFAFSEALDFDPVLAGLMERESLARIHLPYGRPDAWLVTGFESVQRVTTDHRFSRAGIIRHDYPRLTAEPIVSPESINVMDPPHSSRIRHLATQAFTQRHVDHMRERITLLADRLLDEMESEGPPADLVRHLSDTLPQHTILDLLGIERAEWPRMQEDVHRLLVLGAGSRDVARAAKEGLTAYFTELVAERRNNPGTDIISVLAEARDGEDQLDDKELAVLALTFTLSGQDTATCQISNIVYLLLTRPELVEYARTQRGNLTDFLHELLRYIPFRKGVGIPRVALEDVEMDGVVIRRGDFVHVSYLAANRDPDRFADPHEIVPGRLGAQHMTFGWGGHRCIAVPLAMAELEVAVGRLLDRFPALRLAVRPDEVRWDTETIRRFPLELPVAW